MSNRHLQPCNDLSISVTCSRDREEYQGIPPKAEHIVVFPDEINEIDIGVDTARSRLNAETRYYHGIVS
jgi:hypothetical protein